MKRNLPFLKKKSLYLLSCCLSLVACTSEPYPIEVQQELFNYCKVGISSGATVVQHGKDTPLSDKEIERLCHFRVSEFMKEVSLEDYLNLTQHIYENFRRAYSHKYVLKDIYDTLSPEDKRINSAIARIIFGLEEKKDEQ